MRKILVLFLVTFFSTKTFADEAKIWNISNSILPDICGVTNVLVERAVGDKVSFGLRGSLFDSELDNLKKIGSGITLRINYYFRDAISSGPYVGCLIAFDQLSISYRENLSGPEYKGKTKINSYGVVIGNHWQFNEFNFKTGFGYIDGYPTKSFLRDGSNNAVEKKVFNPGLGLEISVGVSF